MFGYQSAEKFPYEDKNSRAVRLAFQELGFSEVDFNSWQQTGVMFFQGTQHKGERRSTNRAFLEPIRHQRSNLKVVTNARVTKILINDQKRAYGVEYAHELDRSKTGTVFADKEIVVSGGSVNSPQLLQLSGIGPADVLQAAGVQQVKELPVGKNLQDHVTTTGFVVTLDNLATEKNAEDELNDDIKNYVQNRNGPFAGIGPTTSCGFAKSRHVPANLDYPDILYGFLSLAMPWANETCTTNVVSPTNYYETLIYWSINVRPKSRGHIAIKSSDPFEDPLIYPNYFGDPQDLDVVVDGYNMGMKALQTRSLRNAGFKINSTPAPGCESYTFASDEYWVCLARNYTQPIFHPAGTCKMGPASDVTAVVDPQLKVHGIKGLRVADCSIMPQIVSGTPNAVAIMIGDRCADFIKKEYGLFPFSITSPNIHASQFSSNLNDRLAQITQEWKSQL